MNLPLILLFTQKQSKNCFLTKLYLYLQRNISYKYHDYKSDKENDSTDKGIFRD